MKSVLIGNPVSHSVSDKLFDFYARSVKLDNYKHIKIKCDKNELENTLSKLVKLNYVGCNVTIPFKTEVIKYLDTISNEALKIGAVNTIVFNNGKLHGYNTDGYGAVEAINNKLKLIKTDDFVLIFGAGGAARAIIYEVSKFTKHVFVVNRSEDRLLNLVENFKNEGVSLKYTLLSNENEVKIIANSCRFLINATSVGMHPNSNESILDQTNIIDFNHKYFFDAVFNPNITKFLKVGQSFDSKICTGLYMLSYQAIKAFELWTTKKINIETANESVILLQNLI
jgi:shikimate dehydrogenase